MGKKYKTTYQIPFYESDINQNVKLPHILSVALQVSGMQSLELGMSDEKIFKDYHLVWVITDYEIEMERLPRYAETVTIETEALSYNRYFCYRSFAIYSQEGQKIMTILSTFVLSDYDSRKVHEVVEAIIRPYASEKIKKINRGPKYHKLADPQETLYHVRYFDLDLNGHVNNSRYIEWMYDVLELDFLKTHIPRKISLKYVKEVHHGKDVLSRLEQSGLITRHEIVSQGQLNAQASIEWRRL